MYNCDVVYTNASEICFPMTEAGISCLDGTYHGLFGTYLSFFECTCNGNYAIMIVLIPWLLLLLIALGSTADVFLMPQLHYLSMMLRLSPDVAGVTLLAIGNGAPDVFSAIAIYTSNLDAEVDLSLSLADIVGGSLFIMTVVVGTVVIIAGNRCPGWTVQKLPFWRDTIALLVAVFMVNAVVLDGKIELWEAIGYLVMHVVYIMIVLLPKLSPTVKAFAHKAGLLDGLGKIGFVIRSPRPDPRGSEFRTSSTEAFLDPFAATYTSPLRGVTANVGGEPLPALVAPALVGTPLSATEADVLPVSRATFAVEPLQLEPQLPRSLVGESSGIDRPNPFAAGSNTTDAERLKWLWGDWGEGTPRSEGGSAPGSRTRAQRGGAPMPLLDGPEEPGYLYRLLWAFELPLSVIRWLSIPSSDGEWGRRRRLWTAASPPLAALLFLTTQFGGDAPHYSVLRDTAVATVGESSMPIWVLVFLCALPVCPLLYLCTCDEAVPRFQPLLVCLGFLMTIVWLRILSAEMIAVIESFGHLFGISTSILGVTVIAIGNSVGDFVSDSAAAREGTVSGVRMAFAACFGSPVIMNIVSCGVSFTLRLLMTDGRPVCFASVDLIPRIGYLLFYVTIFSHMIVIPLCGYTAPRAYGIYLLVLYCLFTAVCLLLEFGAIDNTNESGLCTHFEWLFGSCDRQHVRPDDPDCRPRY